MSEVAKVWEHIDKLNEKHLVMEKEVFGIGSRMTVLENSFQNHASLTTEGQARIETKIECVQKALSDLSSKNSYNAGVNAAKKDHDKFIKWAVGLLVTLIGSGIIVLNFVPK